MKYFLQETKALTWRWFLQLKKEPFSILLALIQPVIWLTLFGNVFSKASSIPGFPAGNYITFMCAGVIVMTVLGNGISGGIPLLLDKESGYLEKILATPIKRSSIIVSRFLFVVLISCIQTLIILGFSIILGARINSGIYGIIFILIISSFFGIGFTIISLALSFLLNSHAEFFAVNTFLTLPLFFASTALMPGNLLPYWLQVVSAFNPLTYAIDSIRSLIIQGFNLNLVLKNLAILLIFDLLCLVGTVRIFSRKIG